MICYKTKFYYIITDMDKLCNDLNNLNVSNTDNRIIQLIHFDLDKLSNYYYTWKERSDDNIDFMIEPLPEVDTYMDENFVDQLYDFLLKDNYGYNLFLYKIKNKNAYEIIDIRISTILYQNYLDMIVQL